MAVIEITETEYNRIVKALKKGSQNDVAKEFNWGNRRIAQIARSKSYKSYLAIRAAERRKRAQNTPAKAVEGSQDLQSSHDELMVNVGGESVPADQAQPTQDGEQDQRPADEVAAQDAERKARADADARIKAYKRAQLFGNIFAYTVIGLAVLGVIAILGGIIYLIAR